MGRARPVVVPFPHAAQVATSALSDRASARTGIRLALSPRGHRGVRRLGRGVVEQRELRPRRGLRILHHRDVPDVLEDEQPGVRDRGGDERREIGGDQLVLVTPQHEGRRR